MEFRTFAASGLKGLEATREYYVKSYTSCPCKSPDDYPHTDIGELTIKHSMASTVVKSDSHGLQGDRKSMLSENMLAFCSTLHRLKKDRCSGRLVVTGAHEVSWTFFFYYGRIMFASGGSHPVRQWLALLRRYTEDSQRQQVLRSLKNYSTTSSEQCWEYEILYESLKNESISRQQLSNICQTVVDWSIFDIWQSGEFQTEFIEEIAKLPKTVLIDPEQATDAAASEWSSWQAAEILAYRPSLGVSVVQADKLQQQTTPTAYQSMKKMLEKNITLREIASTFRKNVKPFIRTLAPFVERGILAWQEIPDLPCPVNAILPTEDASPPEPQSTVTIACIDDSRVICEYMKLFVEEAGFNFIAITNPLQAMETLLEKEPDLVFLDLVMPHTSGYEVCGQLRHHERFKHIPIIILTGNDGIIDRVRAKMVGATDFLGKPLSAFDFDRVIQAHLLKQPST